MVCFVPSITLVLNSNTLLTAHLFLNIARLKATHSLRYFHLHDLNRRNPLRFIVCL